MIEQFQQLHTIFDAKKTFVITTHVNPDGDAIGSEIALAIYLKNKGKSVTIINQSETPDHLLFLHSLFPVNTYNSSFDQRILESECLCVVDTNSPKRFSALAGVVEKSTAVKICIDHHLEQEPFADHYIIDTDVPATSELLYRIFISGDPHSITKPIADALYTGIMTDTGSFKFPKTDVETHVITAELVRCGADPYAIYQQVYESGAVNKLHLLGKALESIQLYEEGKIASMVLSRSVFQETKTKEADVDNFTPYVLSINKVVLGLVFVELADGVKVSFRSKGNISVNVLAKHFGGGGHKNASGARLKHITLQDAIATVVEKAKEFVS